MRLLIGLNEEPRKKNLPSFRWREIPPTAGLPLQWADFKLPFETDSVSSNLEEALSSRFGPGLLTSSATAALVLALLHLKNGSPRRTVIAPGYTCPLVAIAVAQAGLKLKLVDVEASWFDFDKARLAEAMDDDCLCVIPTHLGGLAADIDLAASFGVPVIEDAAQALGAYYKNSPVGTAGDIGVYSLTRGKGLSIYEGGYLRGSPELLAAARQHQKFNIGAEFVRSLSLVGYKLFYNPQGLPLVYGLPLRFHLAMGKPELALDEVFTEVSLETVGTFRSRVGASAFKRLPDFLESNRERALLRASRLEQLGLTVLGERHGRGSWPFLMVLFPDRQLRDRALQSLWTAGLGVTRLFLHALNQYDYLREITPSASLPNSEDLAARMLTVTNSHWLDETSFELVLSRFKKILS